MKENPIINGNSVARHRNDDASCTLCYTYKFDGRGRSVFVLEILFSFSISVNEKITLECCKCIRPALYYKNSISRCANTLKHSKYKKYLPIDRSLSVCFERFVAESRKVEDLRAGLNYILIYIRTSRIPLAPLPFVSSIFETPSWKLTMR